MSKIYIAGPMSGYPNFNFPAFHAAEKRLKEEEGWEIVFNPANKENEECDAIQNNLADGDREKLMKDGFDFRTTFSWDCCKVIEADAIYMLKGWAASPGASAERSIALTMQKYYPEYQVLYEEA